jgi:hypothetical protein
MARVLLYGRPGVGKTTLAAAWDPDKTLILDAQGGTRLLPGEHFVVDLTDWRDFEAHVDLLAAGGHRFRTVVLDTIDLFYEAADRAVAQATGLPAAALIDYGKGTAETDARFKTTMRRLLALPVGVWMVSHATDVEDEGGTKRLVDTVPKRVRTWVHGEADYILCAERVGPRRELHTAPTGRYEAKARVPLPDPLPLDAQALFAAIERGMAAAAPPEPEPKPAPPEEPTTERKAAA